MTVVGILGANGFIGRHLARELVRTGYDVVCFARQFPLDFQEEFQKRARLQFIELSDTLNAYTKIKGIDHIVQLINTTNPSLGNSMVVADIKENVVPQVSFIQSCIEAGVKSFTFLSSGGTVYGVPLTVPIDEDHPCRPLNSYGMTKLVTEQYLHMLCTTSMMRFNILRVANPFGPGQLGIGGQGLIATVLQKHAKGEPLTIFGDGSSQRDYIYIEDTIAAIVSAVEVGGTNSVINIGSGEGRSILDVISTIESCISLPIERVHVRSRSTDTSINVLDVKKAKRLLGWEPQFTFREGISKTVAHFSL